MSDALADPVPSSGRRGLYRLRRPSRRDLAALLARESAGPPTSDPVGWTVASSGPPPGYHRLRVDRAIGSGRPRFEEAKEAIRDWAGHRRAGAIVHPERPPLEVGTEVVMALRVWPLWVTAACRIVEVVDEPDRFGFAYATLAHHPESGEELFVVVRDPSSGTVRLEISAFSRPASRLARLGGPIGRAIQRFMAGRYLDGFQDPASAGRRPANSVRWWFENRETGQITIGQFPNWPLFAIGAVAIGRRLAEAGSVADVGGRWLASGLWLYWGGDELVRGVNPWRRLLGAGVIGWQVLRLLAR